MKRKIHVRLVGIMLAAMMLTGCGKDVSKMDDDELYAYLIDMDEDKRDDFIENLDESQQYRAYEVLMKAEITGLSDKESNNWNTDEEIETEADLSNTVEETVMNVQEKYAPTEEIMNATLADGKVQVADTVFQFGDVCTLGEFVEKYSDKWYFEYESNEIDKEFLETFEPHNMLTEVNMTLRESMNYTTENHISISIWLNEQNNEEDYNHVKWKNLMVTDFSSSSEKADECTWYAGGIQALNPGYTYENYSQYYEKYGYSEQEDAIDFNNIEGYGYLNGFARLYCFCDLQSIDGQKVKLTYEMREDRSTGEMVEFYLVKAYCDSEEAYNE